MGRLDKSKRTFKYLMSRTGRMVVSFAEIGKIGGETSLGRKNKNLSVLKRSDS